MDAYNLNRRAIALAGCMGLVALGLLGAESTAGKGSALKVHRTWMPNAYPSSYAIGFPSGLNFCFDPIRGNLIYAWRGDYVDLSATVNGKIPRDAAIRGTTFYQSLTRSGFSRDGAKADAEIRFRAFRIHGETPEFEYDVEEARVRETVRPSADGTTLIREFRVTTGEHPLAYASAEPVEILIDSGPAKRTGAALQLPANSTVVFRHTLPRQ